jgi:hypothetical protein
MNKIHLDPIYLECRRQQLVRQIKALAAAPGPARPRMLKIRRRQKSLNIINKRLGT